jgi:uncharacterized phiE125 gp8 family phage protein
MINQPILDIKGNRKIKIITEPSIEPVTVAEIKEFARIDHSYEDTLISGFIVAARKQVERYMSKKLIEQTIRLTMDEWNSYIIELPYPPLISVTGVYYVYEDDTTEEYDSDNYYVDANTIPGRLCIKDGQSPPINDDRIYGGYRIDYKAGFGNSRDDISDNVKSAIMVWATDLYEGRADIKSAPQRVRALLMPDWNLKR